MKVALLSIFYGKSSLMTEKDLRQQAWEDSYLRRENHVFQPCDEVVRFVSRYLMRRTDIDTVQSVDPSIQNGELKVIDVGCGIGRNMIFGQSMGLQMFGIELSVVAVEKAKRWMSKLGQDPDRILQGDVRNLSWSDNFFDHALSDSVLDSMPYEIAEQGVAEVARILKPKGLFYCNLIGKYSDISLPDEKVVTDTHEKNTIQSYFDRNKIHKLLDPFFEIIQCEHHTIEDQEEHPLRSRWHVVGRLIP
jgi:ubiquinone/menaquinone biosynthesis C-methylase UbiE